ncbi:MAG: VWA domain-containing protein [Deltaproteobacteria bacterium]|nr:VWA domain-containing protein [Deltaproteobacteria bacterium]
MDRRSRTWRMQSAPLAAARLALSLLVVGACSSGSDAASSDPCKSVYEGDCGGSCTTGADCAAGLYCGGEGTCTADCAPGDIPCKEGFDCSADGRCLEGSLIGGGLGGGSGGGGGLGGGAACVSDTVRGEGLAADLYIMNDQSQSMSCALPSGGDRWGAMKSALTTFVNAEETAGLRVGIQYFGLGGGQGSCNSDDYVQPDVEIGPLPGNARPIERSLERHAPSTYTPTPAAIEGAVRHARDWAVANPDRVVSVLLATDGQPNLCGDDRDRIGSVARIARAAFEGTPSIPVYVIGIVGGSAATGGPGCDLDPAPPNKPDLDRVANAGGTGEAIIVDATAGDTTTQFLAALNRVRGAAVVPCVYLVPQRTELGEVDPTRVNLTLTPDGEEPQGLLQATSEQTCSVKRGGWYYDDPANPSRITLCPASCDIVKSDPRAQVDVLIGCKTEVIPPE